MARARAGVAGGYYLPAFGALGPLMGMDAQTRPGPGKTVAKQDMGTVIGRRGAGRSALGGGNQGAHSLNHYGKKGMPVDETGGFGGGFGF